jgi:Acyl-CoA dehydrogenase, C-terminal domain
VCVRDAAPDVAETMLGVGVEVDSAHSRGVGCDVQGAPSSDWVHSGHSSYDALDAGVGWVQSGGSAHARCGFCTTTTFAADSVRAAKMVFGATGRHPGSAATSSVARVAAIAANGLKSRAPSVCIDVIDRAIQVHEGLGLSDDTPLALMRRENRVLRLVDGADEVDEMAIARRGSQRWPAAPAPSGDDSHAGAAVG